MSKDGNVLDLTAKEEALRPAAIRVREALKHVKPVQGESEYVVASAGLPDRRLSNEDQDLEGELLAFTAELFGWDNPNPPGLDPADLGAPIE